MDTQQAVDFAKRHSALVLAGVIVAVFVVLHFIQKGKTTAAPTQQDAASAMAQAYATEQQSLLDALNGVISQQQQTPTPTPTSAPVSHQCPQGYHWDYNVNACVRDDGGPNPRGPIDPNPILPPRHVDPTPPPPPPPPAPTPQQRSVTVQPWPAQDSTLSGIAAHYSVPGGWQSLYSMDRGTIDNNAHAHGHFGDEYNWLFPGEVLGLPN